MILGSEDDRLGSIYRVPHLNICATVRRCLSDVGIHKDTHGECKTVSVKRILIGKIQEGCRDVPDGPCVDYISELSAKQGEHAKLTEDQEEWEIERPS